MEGNGKNARLHEEVELNLGLSVNGKNPRLHEEVELNLGLSMNGKFGVDPTRGEKLGRSSTLGNPTAVGGTEFEAHAAALWRTQSLRTLQSMRQKKARRKRMGKPPRVPEIGPSMAGSSCTPDPIEVPKSNQTMEVCRQGSHEPSRNDAQINSPISPKYPMLDMPLVTTKDTRSNGRKVDGLLSPCKNGEEVKILCACHGFSLTPKEFVAHGGGGDVEHPLKHIVMRPYPL